MSTTPRRVELARVAARLFAEHGFEGTSMGDIAEAMGVQKGSLYSLTESKQQLLRDAMRSGGDALPRVARRRAGGRTRDRARSRGAPRSSGGRRRAARRRHGVHARVAIPGGRRARRARRGASPLRGALARPVPRRRRAWRAAHGSRHGRRRAARPLRRELGVHLAASRAPTPPSSQTGFSRSSSTAREVRDP